MMFRDGVRWEGFRRRLYYRLCKPPGYWHNREYSPRQSIERAADGHFVIRWAGRGELHARSLTELVPHGESAVIIASGASIKQLTSPERMFALPAACINGSIALATAVGVRANYYVVSDSNFIEQQPDLFRQGVENSDAIILNPKTVLTAMLRLPGLLDGRPIYFREDMRYPFKGRQLVGQRLLRDPRVLAHPGGERAFSLQPAEGTYPGATVAYDAVQILFGIGYAKLYLFGMDLSSAGRFYREGAPSPTRLDRAFHNIIVPSFELVRTYCRQTGKTLLNCSVQSRLPAEVIPKMEGEAALESLLPQPYECLHMKATLPHGDRMDGANRLPAGETLLPKLILP